MQFCKGDLLISPIVAKMDSMPTRRKTRKKFIANEMSNYAIPCMFHEIHSLEMI
jgi:hypothetical protein